MTVVFQDFQNFSIFVVTILTLFDIIIFIFNITLILRIGVLTITLHILNLRYLIAAI